MASLVYLKHKNGTTYVYENVSYWDKKSKKPKSKRKCIGHLDPDTGTVQPNGMRGGNQKNIMPKSEKEPPKCFTYSCGVSSLLDKVCADIGLGHNEKKFSHRILMEYEELCSGSMVKEHQKDYERFFTVKETPKRGRKVEYNQEMIDACRKNSVGRLVLATNFEKTKKWSEKGCCQNI